MTGTPRRQTLEEGALASQMGGRGQLKKGERPWNTQHDIEEIKQAWGRSPWAKPLSLRSWAVTSVMKLSTSGKVFKGLLRDPAAKPCPEHLEYLTLTVALWQAEEGACLMDSLRRKWRHGEVKSLSAANEPRPCHTSLSPCHHPSASALFQASGYP